MSIFDLSGVDDSIDSFIGSLIPSYKTWMDNDNQQKAAARAAGQDPDGMLSGISELGGQAFAPIDAAIRKVPGGSFLLDLPNRAADTVGYVTQHAISQTDDHEAGALSALFSRDSWAKAWDSWGDEGHLSFGNFLVAAHDDDPRVRFADPFDAKEAEAIQAAGHDTWYGELVGAAVDVSVGFASPIPGTRIAKAAKASKVASAANVEKMAEAYKAADGATDSFKTTRVRDTAATYFGGQGSATSQLDQLIQGLKPTDEIPDQVGMMNYLGPWMENSTEAAKSTMANIFVEANKLPTAAAREHVKVNAVLGMMGSPLAKTELVDLAPLVLRSMENASKAPELFALTDDLQNARKMGGSTEYSTNAILDQYFETSGAKAETAALRKELDGHLATAKARREGQSKFDKDVAEAQAAGQEALFAVDPALVKNPLDEAVSAMESARGELFNKRQEMSATAEALAPLANRMADFWNVGEDGYIMTGRVTPSRLDRAKTAFRDTVGEEHLYRTNDTLPNVVLRHIPRGAQAMAAIGTPRARGGINVNDVRTGQLELMETLKRSKAYDPAEVRDAGNRFISAAAEHRGFLLEKMQDDMLQRIASRHGRTAEEALRDADLAKKHYGEGREYSTRAVAGADKANSDIALIVDPESGSKQAFNKAILKSHIQDTAPFMDPTMFDHALTRLDDGLKAKGLSGAYYVDEANTAFQRLWKHAVLLRPGLGVRAMLDTELRAVAMVGAGTQFINAMNGVAKVARGRGATSRPGLARMGLARPVDEVAAQIMGLEDTVLATGKGTTASVRAYEDLPDVAAKRVAMSKGQGVYSGLMGRTKKEFARLQADRTNWNTYDAENPKWSEAYSEHAQVMLASPTVRHMLKDQATDGVRELTVQEFVDDLFSKPGVDAEYNRLARGQDISKAEWAQEILDETSRMFPSAKVTDDILQGRLSKGGKDVQGWIEENFPVGSRFDVPGPNSILREDNLSNKMKAALETFYRTILDEPDFWFARHPVYVSKFNDGIRTETAALLAKRQATDPSAILSAADVAMLDRRAKAAAMTSVRNTFFDTTRYTGAHHYMSKIAPFFAPWEDAMISWGRMIYDDPRRINRLGGAWNAAANASQYMPEPLFVDENGKALARGEESDGEKYIVIPLKGKIPGLQDLRISQDALNSIAQGEVPWLPGFGPTAQLSTTALMTKMLPRDLALDIINNENVVSETFWKSMFFGGELPRGDLGSVAASLAPSSLRNIIKDVAGDNFAANVSWQINKAYLDAQREGRPFDQKKALAEAESAARAAGIVRLISQGIAGLSGRAAVEGQFYVDQMHQIRALSPEQLKLEGYSTPEEMFADKHGKDAAGLDWTLSRNETGINATVKAAKGAYANKGLIGDYPEMGWFIVGEDNVGGEFSRTAYNTQLDDKYGLSAKGRTREGTAETIRGAVVSQGWDQYTKYKLMIDELDKEMNLNEQQRSNLNQLVVKHIADNNREWLVEYNTRTDKLATFWSDADKIAGQSGLSGRPDIEAYKDYRAARDEVLRAVELKSLSGASEKSGLARTYLRQVGEQLAKDNIGFMQMWNRMLSHEVEAKPGDGEDEGVAA